MKSYVESWFNSVESASKKDKKNIIASYNSLPSKDKFEPKTLIKVLNEYERFHSAPTELQNLCYMDFNSFIVKGRPYLRLKLSFEEFDRLESVMSQFR